MLPSNMPGMKRVCEHPEGGHGNNKKGLLNKRSMVSPDAVDATVDHSRVHRDDM